MQPSYAQAHNNLGNLLVTSGQVGAGIQHFREALHYKPGFAEAHNNLGRAFAMSGRHGDAERHIRWALDINPGYADAYSNLGNILADRRAFDLAIEAYQQAIRCQPGHYDARYNMASVYADRGEYREAILELNWLAAQRPPYPHAAKSLGVIWMALGDQQHRSGDAAGARQSWQNALQWDPALNEARQRLR